MEIKATLIKNPLTIVGIFAGLVEITGTAVMPFLVAQIQVIYVWFLMLFPALLVVAFFLTLFFRHHVLYAPSDYRADEGFHRWAPADPRALRLKAEVEQAENLEEQASAVLPEVDSAAPPFTSGNVPSIPAPEMPPSPQDSSSKIESAYRSDEPRPYVPEQARIIRARPSIALRRRVENFIVEDIERRYGAKFLRDRQFDGHSFVYDAVDIESSIPIVLEMKYTVRGMINRTAYLEHLQAAKEVYDRLPVQKRLNFVFVFVFYSDTTIQAEVQRINRSLDVLRSAAADYPFKVLAEFLPMSQLANGTIAQVLDFAAN